MEFPFYLRLGSLKLIDFLDPTLKHDLHTSFMRTCFEISARSVATEERARDMSVGFDKAPLLGLEFLGKIAATAKSTRSDEDLLKYLPYDEKAAEADLLNFSSRLARPLSEPPRLTTRFYGYAAIAWQGPESKLQSGISRRSSQTSRSGGILAARAKRSLAAFR